MPESNSRATTREAAWQETWGSSKFIEQWAAKRGWQAPIRQVQTAMVLRMIPHPSDWAIRVLDIGAGYGALAVAVLEDRPNPTAVCLECFGVDLGRERIATWQAALSLFKHRLRIQIG